MISELVYRRMIKLLALTYAINEEKMWQAFEKVGSIDKIIQMIEQKEIQ